MPKAFGLSAVCGTLTPRDAALVSRLAERAGMVRGVARFTITRYWKSSSFLNIPFIISSFPFCTLSPTIIFPPGADMEQTDHSHLIIDPDRYLVYRNQTTIHLTKTEFRILALIAAARGRILTREQIAQSVWKTEPISYLRTIDVHISNIRKKVGPFDGKQTIMVLKGVGYKIIDDINVIILNDSITQP
jgi:DNA-binding winged helix-turn-helix (wHTH) protein